MTDLRDGIEQRGIDAASVTEIWAGKHEMQAYEINFRKNSGWVINTWYEVLNISGGFELCFLLGHHVSTPAAGQELDVRITIDGRAYTYDASVINPWNDDADEVFSLDYRGGYDSVPQLFMRELGNTQALMVTSGTELDSGWLKGHDLLIEIQDTQAPSAGLDVYMRGEYRVSEAI